MNNLLFKLSAFILAITQVISLPVIDLEVGNAGNPGQPCLNGKAGICGTPSSCKTSTVTGACNGGSNNVCCLKGPGDTGMPCLNGKAGTCGTPSSCKTSTVTGACYGGSDNVCCLTAGVAGVAGVAGGVGVGVGAARPATPSGSSSLALFSPGGAQGQRERFLIAAATGAGLSGTQLAQFLAQMCHESDSYQAMEEYASGADYEWRDDLGNTQPGDGVRYKGRGFIQITGRANYRTYGSKLGLPLEANPTLASNPEIAAKVAISYWKTIVAPQVSDFSATTRVTRLINGGTNGLDDRLHYFKLYSGASPRPLGDFGAKCLNGKNGICGDPKQCKGTVVSGACNGGSDNACCV